MSSSTNKPRTDSHGALAATAARTGRLGAHEPHGALPNMHGTAAVAAGYEILRSSLDDTSHAFSRDEDGVTRNGTDSRTASCGALILVLALTSITEPVPQCLECALKVGAQVDEALVEQQRARWHAIEDAITTTAVTSIRGFVDAARKLDGPEQTRTTRLLCSEPGIVAGWARWSASFTVLIPLGVVGVVIGILDVATNAVSAWTLIALVAGLLALTLSAVGGFLVTRGALQVAIGVHRTSQPHTDDPSGPHAPERSDKDPH